MAATNRQGCGTGDAGLIHVIDDHAPDMAFIREALASGGYRTSEFTTGANFLEALGDLPGGCVLLDLRLDGMSGLTILKEIIARRSDLRVVMISGTGTILEAVEAMRIGASDFIEKQQLKRDLLPAVQRALGRTGEPLPESDAKARAIEIRQHLTPRESEILDLLLKGYRNKQVAYELKVSARTVEAHRANMMRRVGASSFPELIGMVLGNARIQR